jgi:hypothetical protein
LLFGHHAASMVAAAPQFSVCAYNEDDIHDNVFTFLVGANLQGRTRVVESYRYRYDQG